MLCMMELPASGPRASHISNEMRGNRPPIAPQAMQCERTMSKKTNLLLRSLSLKRTSKSRVLATCQLDGMAHSLHRSIPVRRIIESQKQFFAVSILIGNTLHFFFLARGYLSFINDVFSIRGPHRQKDAPRLIIAMNIVWVKCAQLDQRPVCICAILTVCSFRHQQNCVTSLSSNSII